MAQTTRFSHILLGFSWFGFRIQSQRLAILACQSLWGTVTTHLTQQAVEGSLAVLISNRSLYLIRLRQTHHFMQGNVRSLLQKGKQGLVSNGTTVRPLPCALPLVEAAF